MAVLWIIETIFVIFFYYDLNAPVATYSINSDEHSQTDKRASQTDDSASAVEVNDERATLITSPETRTFSSYVYNGRCNH